MVAKPCLYIHQLAKRAKLEFKGKLSNSAHTFVLAASSGAAFIFFHETFYELLLMLYRLRGYRFEL